MNKLSLLLILLAASQSFGAEHQNRKGARKSGEVLFAFKAGASGKLPPGLERTEKLVDGISLAKFKLAPGKQEEDLASEMVAGGEVEFAEPNYAVPPALTPNDPKYGSLWHLAKVGAPAAWDIAHSGQTVVAVCDSGVEDTHPDLRANVVLPGYNTVNATADSKPVNFHGTFVAGMISAVGNNSVGLVGVAWALKILPVRITNQADGWAYYSDMARCIAYAPTRGSRVVNLSYAGAGSSTINSAATTLRSKGGLLVMAGMNDGIDMSASVTDYPAIIVVGATDAQDNKASFSNWGKPIDLVAPGASVQSTTLNGAYSSANGTSFATPMVAGAIGLLFALDPSLTPAQAEEIILSTAKDLGSVGDDSVFGRGRLDLAAALAKGRAKPSPVPSPSPSPSPKPSPVPCGCVCA